MGKHNKQSGVVSFMSVFFISILLTVIVTGFIRIMVNEQRQASDFDQSARAYLAAEAGVEQVVAEVAAGSSSVYGTNCVDNSGVFTGMFEANSNLEVTCALVEPSTDASAFSAFASGETSEIDLRQAATFDEVRIRWHQTTIADSFKTGAYVAQTVDTWGDLPPYLRLMVVSYPDSGVTSSNLTSRTAVLWPASSGSSLSLGSIPITSNSANTPVIQNVDCTPADLSAQDNYYCEARITGFSSSQNYQLNIKPYLLGEREITYDVSVYNGGVKTTINQSIIDIDVTARAGDTFRRIQSSFAPDDITTTTFGYDYAIFGDGGACKNNEVERDANTGNDVRVDSGASC